MIALASISCSDAAGANNIARHIPVFSGQVITAQDSMEQELRGYGLQGRISIQNDTGCSAASDCFFLSLEVRRLSATAQPEAWNTVSVDDFRFPWKGSFWNDTTRIGNSKSPTQEGFLDYPHFFEDYNQTAVFAREVGRNGSNLTVYVASREIGQIAPEPAPVDFVKFEFVVTPSSKGGAVRYHFVPIAMARSKGAYGSALVALDCEIGLEPPDLRKAQPEFQPSQSCPPAAN